MFAVASFPFASQHHVESFLGILPDCLIEQLGKFLGGEAGKWMGTHLNLWPSGALHL